jgi:hypothetical protein
MSRNILILAIVLIVVGVLGFAVLNVWEAGSFYSNNPQFWGMYEMMRPAMMNGVMGYGGYGYGQVPSIDPITPDQAVTRAQTYVALFNNPDLAIAEVMEFSNNFHIRVKETSTGVNAFEILVSRNGGISPEPGPNMMWNAKYSPMANAMGAWFLPALQNSVTAAEAKEKAQQYLNTYLNGAAVADNVSVFHGYYTIKVLRDGKPFGILSVNGTSGAVWYHTWHGIFINEREVQ